MFLKEVDAIVHAVVLLPSSSKSGCRKRLRRKLRMAPPSAILN